MKTQIAVELIAYYPGPYPDAEIRYFVEDIFRGAPPELASRGVVLETRDAALAWATERARRLNVELWTR
jgi:hypothetical protein